MLTAKGPWHFMSASREEFAEDLAGQLGVLAVGLQELGLRVKVVSGRLPPRLTVTNPQVGQLSEVIYAANGRDSGPCFWWSWREPIDAITNTDAVAARIARVLA
jgi:hypothetical protein